MGRELWFVVMWAADCRLISKNITPFAVQSTIFEQTTPTLTESVIVLTRRWNFPGKWNSLSQWYCDKMHAVCSSKHCNLRFRERQLYGDIKAMENVITFTGFWYLIKRTTNSTGIRANWINCPLCKVLLNLYIFPVQNKNCTETYLGPLHRSYIIYLYWSKSSQNVLNVKSLKEFSLLEQYQYVKGFRRFHSGLSPLAIFTFWVFTLWRLTLVLYCKRKSGITAPASLTTKGIS